MFRTDLRRNSISRRVAIFLAQDGAAPMTAELAAARAIERRASIVDIVGERWTAQKSPGALGLLINIPTTSVGV